MTQVFLICKFLTILLIVSTWVRKVVGGLYFVFVERTSYPHQSQYFNQEFPTLGGGNSRDKLPEERASHQPYGQPPRNMRE